MKILRKITALALVALLMISLVACGDDAKEEKNSLTVQFVPTNNDGTMEAQAEPFAKYLTDKLGMDVTVTLATDYTTIVEAMGSGQVDVGIMPPAAYVQARNQKYAKAILTSQLGKYDDATGEPIEGELTSSFNAEILVRADSDLNELSDLKDKNIAALGASSASGYIYPVAEMKNAGIKVPGDVNITNVNDIPSAILSVLEGQQDAMFSFEGTRYVFSGALDKDLVSELRVLYLTEGEIPNDAIAVLPDMDEELQNKIKDVFLNMPNDEEGLAAMSLWGHMGYGEANEAAYDTIEEYIEVAAESCRYI